MSTKTPDFLMDNPEEPEVTQDSLQQLKGMVNAWESNEAQLEEAAAKLKALQETKAQLETREIPQLLLSNGLSRIKLDNGKEVSTKEEVSVSIKQREGFIQFLTNRGEDDIVKTIISFERMSTEMRNALLDFLDNGGYGYSVDDGVHPMTRAAYFRNLFGVGKEDREAGIASGEYLRSEDVEGFAQVFVYYKTRIK